jgi:hypothetical protein
VHVTLPSCLQFACPANSGRLHLIVQRARISANTQEDKEFLRSFFAAQDAKGGKSAWQDQLSRGPKDFFFRDDTDHYIPNVHEIHREIINKQAKKLDSGTKKSVNATLDKHAHHNFMRQDSMKGKRGNAAAARLQQDHISDSHQALGKYAKLSHTDARTPVSACLAHAARFNRLNMLYLARAEQGRKPTRAQFLPKHSPRKVRTRREITIMQTPRRGVTAITTPTITNIPTTMMNGIAQAHIIEVLRTRAIFGLATGTFFPPSPRLASKRVPCFSPQPAFKRFFPPSPRLASNHFFPPRLASNLSQQCAGDLTSREFLEAEAG